MLATVHHAARNGVTERMLTVTKGGVVDLAASDAAIDESVAVCTVMWVNNEVGTIQPVREIAERVKARGGIMHTDAVQAFGKIDIDVSKLAIDLLTISGHKIGAPKGIGAMYVRRGTRLDPLFHGGSQDRGRRPGTENVAYAVALARAAELAVEEREAEWARLESLRDSLEEGLLARIPDAVVHGRGATACAARPQHLGSGHRQRVTAHGARSRGRGSVGRLGVSERKRDAVARAAGDGREARARDRRRAHEPWLAHDAGAHDASRRALPRPHREGAPTVRRSLTIE